MQSESHIFRKKEAELEKKEDEVEIEVTSKEFQEMKEGEVRIFRGNSNLSFKPSLVDPFAPSNEDHYVDLSNTALKNLIQGDRASSMGNSSLREVGRVSGQGGELRKDDLQENPEANYFSYGHKTKPQFPSPEFTKKVINMGDFKPVNVKSMDLHNASDAQVLFEETSPVNVQEFSLKNQNLDEKEEEEWSEEGSHMQESKINNLIKNTSFESEVMGRDSDEEEEEVTLSERDIMRGPLGDAIDLEELGYLRSLTGEYLRGLTREVRMNLTGGRVGEITHNLNRSKSFNEKVGGQGDSVLDMEEGAKSEGGRVRSEGTGNDSMKGVPTRESCSVSGGHKESGGESPDFLMSEDVRAKSLNLKDEGIRKSLSVKSEQPQLRFGEKKKKTNEFDVENNLGGEERREQVIILSQEMKLDDKDTVHGVNIDEMGRGGDATFIRVKERDTQEEAANTYDNSEAILIEGLEEGGEFVKYSLEDDSMRIKGESEVMRLSSGSGWDNSMRVGSEELGKMGGEVRVRSYNTEERKKKDQMFMSQNIERGVTGFNCLEEEDMEEDMDMGETEIQEESVDSLGEGESEDNPNFEEVEMDNEGIRSKDSESGKGTEEDEVIAIMDVEDPEKYKGKEEDEERRDNEEKGSNEFQAITEVTENSHTRENSLQLQNVSSGQGSRKIVIDFGKGEFLKSEGFVEIEKEEKEVEGKHFGDTWKSAINFSKNGETREEEEKGEGDKEEEYFLMAMENLKNIILRRVVQLEVESTLEKRTREMEMEKSEKSKEESVTERSEEGVQSEEEKKTEQETTMSSKVETRYSFISPNQTFLTCEIENQINWGEIQVEFEDNEEGKEEEEVDMDDVRRPTEKQFHNFNKKEKEEVEEIEKEEYLEEEGVLKESGVGSEFQMKLLQQFSDFSVTQRSGYTEHLIRTEMINRTVESSDEEYTGEEDSEAGEYSEEEEYLSENLMKSEVVEPREHFSVEDMEMVDIIRLNRMRMEMLNLKESQEGTQKEDTAFYESEDVESLEKEPLSTSSLKLLQTTEELGNITLKTSRFGEIKSEKTNRESLLRESIITDPKTESQTRTIKSMTVKVQVEGEEDTQRKNKSAQRTEGTERVSRGTDYLEMQRKRLEQGDLRKSDNLHVKGTREHALTTSSDHLDFSHGAKVQLDSIKQIPEERVPGTQNKEEQVSEESVHEGRSNLSESEGEDTMEQEEPSPEGVSHIIKDIKIEKSIDAKEEDGKEGELSNLSEGELSERGSEEGPKHPLELFPEKDPKSRNSKEEGSMNLFSQEPTPKNESKHAKTPQFLENSRNISQGNSERMNLEESESASIKTQEKYPRKFDKKEVPTVPLESSSSGPTQTYLFTKRRRTPEEIPGTVPIDTSSRDPRRQPLRSMSPFEEILEGTENTHAKMTQLQEDRKTQVSPLTNGKVKEFTIMIKEDQRLVETKTESRDSGLFRVKRVTSQSIGKSGLGKTELGRDVPTSIESSLVRRFDSVTPLVTESSFRTNPLKKSVVTFVNAFETDTLQNSFYMNSKQFGKVKTYSTLEKRDKSAPVASLRSGSLNRIKEAPLKRFTQKNKEYTHKITKIIYHKKSLPGVTQYVSQKPNTANLYKQPSKAEDKRERGVGQRKQVSRSQSPSYTYKIHRPVSYDHVKAKVSSRRKFTDPLMNIVRPQTNFISKNIENVRRLSQTMKKGQEIRSQKVLGTQPQSSLNWIRASAKEGHGVRKSRRRLVNQPRKPQTRRLQEPVKKSQKKYLQKMKKMGHQDHMIKRRSQFVRTGLRKDQPQFPREIDRISDNINRSRSPQSRNFDSNISSMTRPPFPYRTNYTSNY